jgi:hypothetical protein
MSFGMAEAGTTLGKKYWVALGLYAALAVLSWFTLDARIPVGGRLVELRLVPLVIIGGLALRTMLAMKAEKIRRQEGETPAKVYESRVNRKVGL